jgi:uncharacterized protein YbjT (DUF2867 family)
MCFSSVPKNLLTPDLTPTLVFKILKPRKGRIEIAGPERAPFNEIVARYLKAIGDPREVVE